MAIHPDTLVTFTTSVTYDPVFVVHPATLITLTTSLEYLPPPSSGGQPKLTITLATVLSYTPSAFYYDLEGDAEIFYTASGTLELELLPVPVPTDVEQVDVRRISVRMPTPTTFDRFGRPTS
jgi:hypothetical protein